MNRAPVIRRIVWCVAWLAFVLLVSAFGACRGSTARRTGGRSGYVVPGEDDASIHLAGPQPLAAFSARVERTPRVKGIRQVCRVLKATHPRRDRSDVKVRTFAVAAEGVA